MGSTSATVEVLTAEVRVLMVGSRQVTLSVYRQLDAIAFNALTPFGRVRGLSPPPGDFAAYGIEFIGADREGRLCRSWLARHPHNESRYRCADPGGWYRNEEAFEADWAVGEALPLIVLAGLR
jgi:hypothetical protein